MQRFLVAKFGRVSSSVQPDVLQYFYQDLTGDSCAATNLTEEKLIAEFTRFWTWNQKNLRWSSIFAALILLLSIQNLSSLTPFLSCSMNAVLQLQMNSDILMWYIWHKQSQSETSGIKSSLDVLRELLYHHLNGLDSSSTLKQSTPKLQNIISVIVIFMFQKRQWRDETSE